MKQIEETVVTKDQLLRDYVKLREWLTEYWTFLEKLPLDVFVEQEHLVYYLREQRDKLEESRLKLKSLELIGAFLNFAIQRVKSESMVFRLPREMPEPPPVEYQEISTLSMQAKKTEAKLNHLVDQILYLASHLPIDSEERMAPLLRTIGSLFKAIIRQDGEDMKIQINQINLLTSTKDSYLLVNEVGKITREIYNSLQELSHTLDTDDIRNAADEMPDAVEKLYSVIKRLEEAANDNLEFLETLLQQGEENTTLVLEMNTAIETLHNQMQQFADKNPDHKDVIDSLQTVLQQQLKTRTDKMIQKFQQNENLFLTIMTNQGFQDLTGQTLKKIIDFIERLEMRLVELIKQYSTNMEMPGQEIDTMTRIDHGVENEEIKLHGPDEMDTKKSNQNDVDSLLAELGF